MCTFYLFLGYTASAFLRPLESYVDQDTYLFYNTYRSPFSIRVVMDNMSILFLAAQPCHQKDSKGPLRG